jgi:hypothetical protein
MMSPFSVDCDDTTMVSLTFTKQKKGTEGEVITHGISTNPFSCPVKSIVRRIRHLHLQDSKKSIPIVSYFHYGRYVTVKAKDITDALCLETLDTSHQTGLHPRDISARSLRVGVLSPGVGKHILVLQYIAIPEKKICIVISC